MFNWPIPPRTLTVRQLECVACKAFFTIAEDDITRSSSAWRTPRDGQPPDIRLRYQPDRQRRPVMSEGRADIPPDAVHFSDWDENRYDQVICPRCGADNRNWLYVNNNPFGGNWLNNRSMMASLLASAVTAAIAVFWFISFRLDDLSPLNVTKAATLFFVVLMTGGIVTRLSAQSWRSVRDFNNLRQVAPSGAIMPAAWRNILLAMLFIVLVAPPLFTIGAPLTLNQLYKRLDPPPSATVKQQIGAAVNNLNAAGTQSEGDLKNQLQNLAKEAERVQTTVIDQPIQTAAANSAGDRWNPFQTDKLMLLVWITHAGFAAALAIFITWGAVAQYAAAINRQLPRPLYHSLANMTRVVVWEAKHTLEVPGDMSHVQWTHAERNLIGGIELVGFHRGVPEFDKNGQPISTMVMSQKYTIGTDRWGKILEATIKDTLTPRTVDTPTYMIASAEWPAIPDREPLLSRGDLSHPLVGAQIPPPRSINRQSTQIQHPRTNITGSAEHRNEHLQSTAEPLGQFSRPVRTHPYPAQPSARRETAPIEPLSPYKRAEIAKLRHYISQYFDETELRDICFDLGVDYPDLRGQGRKDKSRELVLHLDRRQRIPELVDICRRQRPNVEWPNLLTDTARNAGN
jgi:hypothetical protein